MITPETAPVGSKVRRTDGQYAWMRKGDIGVVTKWFTKDSLNVRPLGGVIFWLSFAQQPPQCGNS